MEHDLINKCAKIKQDAAVQLMELTRDACRIKIEKLNDEILQHESRSQQQVIDDTDRFEQAERTRMKKKLRTGN